MAKPNPNLWAVKYTYGSYGAESSLWILAADAAIAQRKARRFLKKSGEKRTKIIEIKHEGTIDAF